MHIDFEHGFQSSATPFRRVAHQRRPTESARTPDQGGFLCRAAVPISFTVLSGCTRHWIGVHADGCTQRLSRHIAVTAYSQRTVTSLSPLKPHIYLYVCLHMRRAVAPMR
ncbi:hypothetical protein BIFGAL_02711 [Bifidobacterium gallicum DSM 20093 = LMG 11596]|uniref:Uncharacterized protein n=1 Tax=Bifidobacterium gallicum DSM 20093 = LMG 11596 TaxID=561180 RepID=D1NSF3_9BIFI|nr:hypothetical protein BIFGAL_02711 [Bifidobacterium gallicum DSM 20093 = LMG 11596]